MTTTPDARTITRAIDHIRKTQHACTVRYLADHLGLTHGQIQNRINILRDKKAVGLTDMPGSLHVTKRGHQIASRLDTHARFDGAEVFPDDGTDEATDPEEERDVTFTFTKITAEIVPDPEPPVQPGTTQPGVDPLDDGASPDPEVYVVKGSRNGVWHAPDAPFWGRTKAVRWYRTGEDAEADGYSPAAPPGKRPL